MTMERQNLTKILKIDDTYYSCLAGYEADLSGNYDDQGYNCIAFRAPHVGTKREDYKRIAIAYKNSK